MFHKLYEELGISRETADYCLKIEESLKPVFSSIDQNAEYNGLKVIQGMQVNQVSDIHFAATTGYGYNDLGRDTLEKVYATVFRAESALVRPQVVSGTHALSIALSGNLRPGDEILSVIGKPYDTLQGVFGIRKERGSFSEYGITYRQVDLLPDYSIDYDGISKAINEKTKLVLIQRSKGYEKRPSLSVKQIGDIIRYVKGINDQLILMVDNCYGEFVETVEPSEAGADLVVGSLIKNPGGGLAPIGGYILGKEEYVENAASRLTAPGLGKELGATLGLNQQFFQGLFFAPTVVAAALKTAVFIGALFESLGYEAFPHKDMPRYDIVQAINMKTEAGVIAFCEGIQAAAPVDSFVRPVPWDMPGYDAKVIMAAGAFVQGSSIELSADAPIKPPYTVFFQGGLTWPHGRFGGLKTLQSLVNAGIIKL